MNTRAVPPGIYVERLIHGDLEHLWRLTQDPSLHQQWDLRFSEISYLPKASESEPQRFLYETRIGFGLRIQGNGESVGTRESPHGDRTSSLKFSSDDPKSMIRQGSGYWKYIPGPSGVKFLTWYDYTVRFGSLGRLVDRCLFRPLIGWATAWSFDRLRLWIEQGQSPQTSLTLFFIHALSRLAVAFVWAWHGLVPKLLFHNADEQIMLMQTGLPVSLLKWFGAAEIIFAVLIMSAWRSRAILFISAALMVLALLGVAFRSPAYLGAAFNPVTLNISVISLSAIAFLSSKNVPSARNCLRKPASERA